MWPFLATNRDYVDSILASSDRVKKVSQYHSIIFIIRDGHFPSRHLQKLSFKTPEIFSMLSYY